MNENTSKNVRGGVFPDEETFDRIYSECMDKAQSAPESVQENYQKMWDAFEEYLSAADDWLFRIAYEFGYEAGRKGGAAE